MVLPQEGVAALDSISQDPKRVVRDVLPVVNPRRWAVELDAVHAPYCILGHENIFAPFLTDFRAAGGGAVRQNGNLQADCKRRGCQLPGDVHSASRGGRYPDLPVHGRFASGDPSEARRPINGPGSRTGEAGKERTLSQARHLREMIGVIL